MPGSGEALVMLLLVLGLVGWIVALVDCLRNEPQVGNDRLIWLLVIVLAGWIGALIYWLVRRPQRNARAGDDVPRL
jgi:hypothetical protein